MSYYKHINRFIFIFTFLMLIPFIIKGQEILISVPTGYLSTKENQKVKRLKNGISLELPFFDDFSDSFIKPDPDKWEDNDVFINHDYAVNPPSLGVASFDAVDNTGKIYDLASPGNVFYADKLTSGPVNLNYPLDQTIFLSFYYQPQGLADNPETQDSLLLEFYAPQMETWNTVWRKEGSDLTDFVQVIIPVDDAKYLHDGFRFRFRNKASLTADNNASRIMNCDHWHIDYVYLNRNRNINDTVHRDFAFYKPLSSLLKNYEAMPWKHFLTNPQAQLKTNITSHFRNNDNVTRLIDSIYFVFYDNSGNEPNDTLFGGSYDIAPGSLVKFDPPYLYPFLTNTSDSASFNIKAKLITDGFDPKVNNEVIYRQKFFDYYAYDDGTAEAGYGLTGDGAQNAKLACRFNAIKQDTLKAVQMYFNRSFQDKNQKYFLLTVWNDNNGLPGEIIYQKKGTRPEFENELNKFHTYYIDDTVLVINGVFYVGWVQTTSDLLNLGFDFNRDNKQNNLYNINGDWKNSSYQGALMIRPFFGKMLTTNAGPIKPKIKPELKIYPNPVNDQLMIEVDNYHEFKQITVYVYSITGMLIKQTLWNPGQPIDLSGIKNGNYLIRLNDKSGRLNHTQKIIKL
jgi:hypothetical protein